MVYHFEFFHAKQKCKEFRGLFIRIMTLLGIIYSHLQLYRRHNFGLIRGSAVKVQSQSNSIVPQRDKLGGSFIHNMKTTIRPSHAFPLPR